MGLRGKLPVTGSWRQGMLERRRQKAAEQQRPAASLQASSGKVPELPIERPGWLSKAGRLHFDKLVANGFQLCPGDSDALGVLAELMADFDACSRRLADLDPSDPERLKLSAHRAGLAPKILANQRELGFTAMSRRRIASMVIDDPKAVPDLAVLLSGGAEGRGGTGVLLQGPVPHKRKVGGPPVLPS